MMIELGGGTNPHPRADVVIDLHHPVNSPAQDASTNSGKLPGNWIVNPGTPGSHRVVTVVDVDNFHHDIHMLDEGSVDEVYASHFMEHIPHGQPLLGVMNEAWRVLRPGGSFTMVMPLVGYTSPAGNPLSDHIGWQPWADPTHVSYWWFPEALLYFCYGPFKPNADYGIRTWAPLGGHIPEADASAQLADLRCRSAHELGSFWSVRDGWEGIARLIKP